MLGGRCWFPVGRVSSGVDVVLAVSKWTGCREDRLEQRLIDKERDGV